MDCGLLGDPSTKQMKCGDCLFELNYNSFLNGEEVLDKSKPRQTVQICVQCSLHWRGPSRYYVCGQCAENFIDSSNNDASVVNRHTEIFYIDERKVMKSSKKGDNDGDDLLTYLLTYLYIIINQANIYYYYAHFLVNTQIYIYFISISN
jgi:hypothetical protein